ncbi:MAG: hypothetical protein JST22_18435 [Bacteroidetes bacterium]|nr:hypothetical protein [Bacteroidota bacterium]
MSRTILSSTVLAVAAAFVLASCGKDIPAEMTKSFDDAQSGVMKQLDEVKTKLTDQMNKCMALPKDSTKKAAIDALDAELKSDETQVGEIEKTLNDLKTQKDSLVTAHKATEFKTLWEKAQTTYADLGTKIASINTALDASAQKLQALGAGKPAASAGADSGKAATPAGDAKSGMDSTMDKAHAAASDAKTKAEAKVSDAKAKVDEAKKAVHSKAADAEKTLPLRPNTNPGEKEKPVLRPNTNP